MGLKFLLHTPIDFCEKLKLKIEAPDRLTSSKEVSAVSYVLLGDEINSTCVLKSNRGTHFLIIL